MKNIIIIGSSGMIGSSILEKCLQRNDVEQITTIVRKKTGLQHDKLHEIVHDDFLNFTSIENVFQNQDICFYCLGVYTGQVPVDEFKTITVDYTIAFASMLKQQSPESTFIFLSGQGADIKEQSKILFARQKGIAENALLKLNFPKTQIFRPGYIYPVVPRKEPNFFYRLMRILYKPISFIYPNIGVSSEQLANKMIASAFANEQKIIFENEDIRVN